MLLSHEASRYGAALEFDGFDDGRDEVIFELAPWYPVADKGFAFVLRLDANICEANRGEHVLDFID